MSSERIEWTAEVLIKDFELFPKADIRVSMRATPVALAVTFYNPALGPIMRFELYGGAYPIEERKRQAEQIRPQLRALATAFSLDTFAKHLAEARQKIRGEQVVPRTLPVGEEKP